MTDPKRDWHIFNRVQACGGGWALADHLQASLAIEALDMALSARNPAPDLIHHSDRGVQYACADYGETLEARGIHISMSRAGNPYSPESLKIGGIVS